MLVALPPSAMAPPVAVVLPTLVVPPALVVSLALVVPPELHHLCPFAIGLRMRHLASLWHCPRVLLWRQLHHCAVRGGSENHPCVRPVYARCVNDNARGVLLA